MVHGNVHAGPRPRIRRRGSSPESRRGNCTLCINYLKGLFYYLK
uniref:Uncharacterized protein n=1 Tax=Arundo donax TaxID=35708 RepID=A0A0A8YX65_ARUDO